MSPTQSFNILSCFKNILKSNSYTSTSFILAQHHFFRMTPSERLCWCVAVQSSLSSTGAAGPSHSLCRWAIVCGPCLLAAGSLTKIFILSTILYTQVSLLRLKQRLYSLPLCLQCFFSRSWYDSCLYLLRVSAMLPWVYLSQVELLFCNDCHS